MNCPRDGVELLESVPCASCSGLWLHKGELEAILEAHRRAGQKDDPREESGLAAYRVADERRERAFSCPACGTEMERREYGMTSQVLVDTCPQGCGIWLDKGELAALEGFYDAEKADANDEGSWYAGLARLLLG